MLCSSALRSRESSMALEHPVLRGETIVLRPLCLDDAGALAAASAESREH